eukprot:CAMPEP_0174716290 /NCGR_PEP_ID=MMETSP1094-20130205/23619_1 /TAXON_ID=156173 /ORGANISM="Chrysochromulina brevifilum, Strain UTEX LB 985" /LENGTH=104 /DNA_ID=CAMNT_0015915995 /DNA_START=492 /DNA_END=803 /DNA_ORIENTATION=-
MVGMDCLHLLREQRFIFFGGEAFAWLAATGAVLVAPMCLAHGQRRDLDALTAWFHALSLEVGFIVPLLDASRAAAEEVDAAFALALSSAAVCFFGLAFPPMETR